MKVTHKDFLKRVLAGSDYEAIGQIEDACSRDLDEAFAQYDAAILNTKKAATVHEKNWAKVAEANAKMNYLAKFAAYSDFVSGY